MADTAVVPSSQEAPLKAVKAVKKTTKPKASVDHPKYAEMITAAIKSLKERGGSSRQAILKYVIANYKVGKDAAAVNVHLKQALRRGVTSNLLKQSKGTGASGSFRIGEQPKPKKPNTKKPKAAKKATKSKKPTKKTTVKKPKAKKPSPKKAKTTKKSAKSPKRKSAPKAKKSPPKKTLKASATKKSATKSKVKKTAKLTKATKK